MLNTFKLIALENKHKSLEQQLSQLQLSTKEVTPDNLNKIAKVGFELINVNIKIKELKSKK
jgi:hypothetical protein